MSRLPREDERIARLLDGTEPPRDVPAARLVAVADRLRAAARDPAPDPSADFTAALRERLLAQAPGELPRPRTPDGPDSPHAVLARTYRRTAPPAARPGGPVRPSRAARSERTLRTRRRVLVTVALIGAVLSGSTMVASNDSLPGQPLYKVKLTVENMEVALERDPASRGRLHLAQARSRAEEIGRVARATGHPEELVGTLDAMDRLTRTGFRELATAAVTKADGKALAELSRWVATQQDLVDRTYPALPGSARLRVTQSLSLLRAASRRAGQLAERPSCGCAVPPQDDLGPLPGWCPACPPPAGGIAPTTTPPAVATTPAAGPTSTPEPSGTPAPSSAAPTPSSTPSTGGDGGVVVPPPAPTFPTRPPPSSTPRFPGPPQPRSSDATGPPTPAPTPAPSGTPSGLDVLEAVDDLIPPILGG